MTFEAGRLSRFTAAGIITGLNLAASMLFGTCALAQPWPNKPVRVVIPWPPGGTNDIVGRAVVQRMGTQLGTAFVVENRAGAAGTIGAAVVAAASGDGYTLMVHSATHLSNASTYKSLPYRTIEDFTPLAFLSGQPWVLVVHPSLPVKSVKEFIALARAKPGGLDYGSSGSGSSPHFGMEAFANAAGIRLNHVPYRGGPPSMNALLGGEVVASAATLSNAIGPIKAGRLRALGVSTLTRQPTLPDVPPLAEAAALPGFEMNPWIGLFGAGGMRRDLAERLNSEANRALRDPDTRKIMESVGLDPLVGTLDEFAARVKADLDRYARLVKQIGLQPE